MLKWFISNNNFEEYASQLIKKTSSGTRFFLEIFKKIHTLTSNKNPYKACWIWIVIVQDNRLPAPNLAPSHLCNEGFQKMEILFFSKRTLLFRHIFYFFAHSMFSDFLQKTHLGRNDISKKYYHLIHILAQMFHL